MNLKAIENFHNFDGVRHLDYTPQIGDIVNVVNDITGIDKNGNAYKVAGSGIFSSNVAQIMSKDNSTITLNDGTNHSPVVIVYPPDGSFEPANFINQKLFSPYTVTMNVASNVVKTVENVATGVTSFASDITGGFSDKIKWLVIAAIIIGVVLLVSNVKKIVS